MKCRVNMLDRWASSLEERRHILHFWEWLMENDKDVTATTLNDVDIEMRVSIYHGIDHVQLENERRLLLDRQTRGGE